MIRITIEANDVAFCFERHEDGSGLWDWCNRHQNGFGPVVATLDGRDVLWQVAGLCNPPSVQRSEMDVHTDVPVTKDQTK